MPNINKDTNLLESNWGLWLPLIIWFIIMISVSSYPKLEIPQPLGKMSDKYAHLIEYAILTFLLTRAWTLDKRLEKYNTYSYRYTIILLLSIILAALDEIHQKFIPGRFCSSLDFIADSIGNGLGIIIWNIYFKIRIDTD